jgi:hypothetical protein
LAFDKSLPGFINSLCALSLLVQLWENMLKKRKNLEINFLICRVDNCVFPVSDNKIALDYRGCCVNINTIRRTCTIQIKSSEQIKHIFHEIKDFGKDFSEHLSEYFGRKYFVTPKVVNVQVSKALNIPRTTNALRQFIIHIHESIISVKQVRIGNEDRSNPDIYFGKDAMHPIYKGFGNLFMSVCFQGNGFSCRVQISKDKSTFLAAFVFSHFGEEIQKFINELNTRF